MSKKKKKKIQKKETKTKIREKIHQLLWRQESSRKDRYRYHKDDVVRESIP